MARLTHRWFPPESRRLMTGLALRVVLAGVLCLVNSAAADIVEGGGSGLTGAFADLEPGGRAAGLGGALGPLVDDASAIHYNPAQLVAVSSSGMTATYADLYGLNLVHHTGVFVAFPFFAHEATWDKHHISEVRGIPSTVYGLGVQATQVDLDPESYSEYDIALAMARPGPWGVRYGFVGHMLIVRSDLDDTDASGFSFDIGLAHQITPAWNSTIMLRSVFSSLKWENDDEETLVPRALIGLAYRVTETIQVPAEFIYDLERSHLQRIAGGMEWSPLGPPLTLRAGARWTDDGDTSDLLPAAGMGLHWRGIHFDYGLAFAREELGDTHQFSLRYHF